MKKYLTLLKISGLAALVSTVCSVSAQNIVSDPGFEASADGVGAHPFSSSWTAVDPSGFTNVGGDTTDAHTGANYANLGASPNVGTLSQLLSTSTGQRYTFSFWLANNVAGNPPGSNNSFQALFGTSLFFTPALTAPPFSSTGAYTFFTAQFLATSNSTLLQFQFRNDADFWRLDDISVVATPEGGASLWLAIPIFAGLCLIHARSNRRRLVTNS